MELLSDAVAERSFERVKRGYDVRSVDAFLSDVGRRIRSLEAELAIAHGKVSTYERTAAAGKDANTVVQDAFRVATLRRDEIIAEATAKAAAIVADAELRTRPEVAFDASSATVEADVIIAGAREEAGNIVVDAERRAREILRVARVEADHEAAAAMVDTREATTAARIEHDHIARQLRDLKNAVNRMLQDGVEGHEEIRLVFAEGVTTPAP